MKKKEIILWKLVGDDYYIVIDPDEEMRNITKKISFFETTAYMFDPDIDINLLKKCLIEYKNREEDDLLFGDILDKYGINYEIADDSEFFDPDVVLCFPEDDDIDYAICTMDDLCDSIVSVFRYWDGSNMQEIWFDVCGDEEVKIVIDQDSKINLDQWDGSNWMFKCRFNHGSLYRIIEIDDEPIKEEKWLLWEWSQCQGALDTGQILNKEEAKKLIDEVENS